ncbi:TonB-dependent receptor [Solitalea lacus]|uniref:TonB-dependent receptor n=1 Tax=Solitalea lacus TaxID=2911172 RepID=UPI001EDBF2C6|nr:carboxypeptidase regulatory-like domain-containing protein [Solitalea lacus]UKJ07683.1 carboxypeptidase-like regulatory domain-containing protein [Solitalea lacus]
MKRVLLIYTLLFISQYVLGQQLTQSVRGKVVGKELQDPLSNLIVQLVNAQLTTVTAADGSFRFSAVPLGRYTLKVSSVGYKSVVMPDIIVNSSKEVVLQVEMEQKVIDLDETTVTAEKWRKDNRMSSMGEATPLSSHEFNVQEVNKFAGSLGDPVRMITNNPGVVGLEDKRNDISVRGNSPMGLLWRLDGVDIPNPNHLGGVTNGGGISILNTNVLANSSFYTGAFSAEFGNATSSVFDLKMRNGNDEKYEFISQVGFTGLEAGIEGPISKKNKSSFLLNYRYSTLDALNSLGLKFGVAAIPKYQDVSFKLHFPVNSTSSVSVFGIGGSSDLSMLDSKPQTGSNKTIQTSGEDLYYGFKMGALGLVYLKSFQNNSCMRLSLSSTIQRPDYSIDSVSSSLVPFHDEYFASQEMRTSLQGSWSKKWNSHWSARTGVVASRIDFKANNKLYKNDGVAYARTYNSNAQTYFMQAFLELKHKPTERLTFIYGGHWQQLFLNNNLSIEPRISVIWGVNSNSALSLGVGLHSQMQPMMVYFRKIVNTERMTNRNLDFNKSLHMVIGYDWSLSRNWRMKAESYYQHLYQIPVHSKFPAFSLINQGEKGVFDFEESLKNTGTGRNYGVELSLEKIYNKNVYFLFTSSLYNSLYTPSDGKERSTVFNGNYIFNALGGYEALIGARGNKKLAMDVKITYAGGKRYSPLNMSLSEQAHAAVYDDNQMYSRKLKDYFRTDVKVSLRINGLKVSQEWLVAAQNVFNTQNPFEQTYNKAANNIKTEYQLGLIPVFGFKIEF